MNPRFAEIFGYTQGEVCALASAGLVASEGDRPRVMDNLQKSLAGELGSVRYAFCGKRKDGSLIDVEVQGGRTLYHGQTAVIGTLADITERALSERALRDSERRFRELLERVQMIALVLDVEGRIDFCNDYLLERTGWSREEVQGQIWFDLFVPEAEREARLQRYRKRIEAKELRSQHESILLTRTGERLVLEFSNTLLLGPSGEAQGIASVAVDVTEQRRAQAALQESEERYALAALGANDGLWDWNPRTGAVYFSPRWTAMLGLGEGELPGTLEAWAALVHPEDRRRFRAELYDHVDGRSPHLESEHRLQHADGSWRWMLVRGIAVRDSTGRATRVAGSQTDITERKGSEEKLLHDAFHDALTGLPNRALLMDRLALALQRMRRRPQGLFAVLFIDLDRFKVVNDSLGHVAGDQLLMLVAQRLAECTRPGDTTARFGGDEFVILLEDLGSPAEAEEVALVVQRALALPMDLDGQEVFATASVGVALSRPEYTLPEELLRDADTAMYQAKEQRAQHVLFHPGMHEQMVDRFQLQHSLRPALERGELFLVYQPVVSLADHRLVGCEALLRWQHPTRGVVPPAEFVPIAEETGLIIPIGDWVLEQACRQAKVWQRRFPDLANFSMSVNLSARQFQKPDLVARMHQILEESALDPACLHLEITESVIMDSAAQAAAMIQKLKRLGVHLHLDDFGTGYSSLAYLHHFHVDALKIDRSFVSRMGQGDGARIVRAIVHLAHDLGIPVVAEGTETSAQVEALAALDCDFAQGYFFARPLSVPDFEALASGRGALAGKPA